MTEARVVSDGSEFLYGAGACQTPEQYEAFVTRYLYNSVPRVQKKFKRVDAPLPRQKLPGAKKRSGRVGKRFAIIRANLAAKQGGLCMYCGVVMTAATPWCDTSVTLEHVTPIAIDRRPHREREYGAACRKCNMSRGTQFGKFLDAWRDD